VQAWTDWAPISQDELKMKDLPEQPGAPAFVLYHEQIDDNAMKFKSVYIRMKVLTEVGRKYADVQIPYDRSRFNIGDIKGRTIHSDGTVVEFQGKPFDKLLVKSKYIREQVKSFTLPDVQIGSVLEYRYSIRYDDRWVYLPQWELQSDLFQRKVHFRFVITTRTVQDNHGRTANGVSFSWLTPNQVQPKWDNRGGYNLDLANVPAFLEEEHMLPAKPFRYYVNFYYQFYDSPEAFWKEQGKFWNKDVDKFMAKKGGVAEVVSGIVAPTDSPEEKVKKIYAYVGNLENLSYRSQNRTAEEQKVLGLKDVRGAEDVLRQKSGTRDDLARLFVTMVRAAGIPAWVIRVVDRGDSIFEMNYLEFDQLDAELAIVKLNDKEVYLDPGSKYCPYGMMYWRYSGTKGIRQAPNGGTEIGATPNPQYNQATILRVGSFKMNEQGEISGKLRVTFSGQEALLRRLEGLNTDDVGRTKILEDEAKSWLPSNAEVSLEGSPDWKNSEGPLVAEYKLTSPMLSSAGKRMLMPMNPLQFNQAPMFTHSARTHEVYFEFPGRQIDEIHVTLPDNVRIETLPNTVSARLGYAMYKAERKQSPREIVQIRDLAIAAFVLPPGEYKNVKSFYDKVKECDDEQAILTSGPNVAKN
jgi:hypothetical protein